MAAVWLHSRMNHTRIVMTNGGCWLMLSFCGASLVALAVVHLGHWRSAAL